MKIKKLKLTDVRFTVEAGPEDAPVRGNALASGDDKKDRECEDAIIADLNSGNDWAWCCVKVTGHYATLTGCAYLGACSYKSREEFSSDNGYLPQMKEEILEDLQGQIDALAKLVVESEA